MSEGKKSRLDSYTYMVRHEIVDQRSTRKQEILQCPEVLKRLYEARIKKHCNTIFLQTTVKNVQIRNQIIECQNKTSN